MSNNQKTTVAVRAKAWRLSQLLLNKCTGCKNGVPDNGYRVCRNCLDKQSARHKQMKVDIINAYGGSRCSCCNELKAHEFLQIDHIAGNGWNHRHGELKSKSFYDWLKRNKYPTGFQILCADCNFAKGQKSECPHKAERRELIAKLATISLTY